MENLEKLEKFYKKCKIGKSGDESGIRTHAPEETGALNQRLRPLGHLAHKIGSMKSRKEKLIAARTLDQVRHWNPDVVKSMIAA